MRQSNFRIKLDHLPFSRYTSLRHSISLSDSDTFRRFDLLCWNWNVVEIMQWHWPDRYSLSLTLFTQKLQLNFVNININYLYECESLLIENFHFGSTIDSANISRYMYVVFIAKQTTRRGLTFIISWFSLNIFDDGMRKENNVIKQSRVMQIIFQPIGRAAFCYQ